MKAICVGIALMAVSWPAAASDRDFEDATSAGTWRGCVEQAGFESYPITLSPHAEHGLNVTYPGLCSGTHRPADSDGFDAVEEIDAPTGNCVSVAKVTYALQSDGALALTFWWNGAQSPSAATPMARARLVRGRSDMPAPVCTPQDAIS